MLGGAASADKFGMRFGGEMLGAIVEVLNGIACLKGVAEFAESFHEETLLSVAVFALAQLHKVFDLLVVAALDVGVFHLVIGGCSKEGRL